MNINVQNYINEILDKIREDIKEEAYDDISGLKLISVNRVDKIISKYKKESEDKE